MRQVILDTETTGLQIEEGHRVIEIGCIELINRKFTGKRFHQYINPQRVIEEGALAVHGITNQFLESKPVFAQIAKDFIEFINGAELIIHNAPFDIKFLNHELNLTNQTWPSLTETCRIIDTLVLARQMHMGQRNSLDALCKRYGVDHSQRDLHGALLDAHLLAQVYLAMTGGQGSLFDDLQIEKHSGRGPIEVPVIHSKRRKLIILHAASDELNAHEEKLLKMKEKGNCLWEALSSVSE